MTTLHSFTGLYAPSTDGQEPLAGLVFFAGALYGTTDWGGTYGSGTVFRLTGAGESVLHNFAGGADGAFPKAGLLPGESQKLGSVLFGTTEGGGTTHNGTVFMVTAAGAESIVHAFTGSPHDGAGPLAGLIADASGSLYGTTFYGGAQNRGTVFKLTPSGTSYTESVIHSFAGTDGSFPAAGLIASAGMLFGTTEGGGTSYEGTVFKLSPSGSGYVVLHSFTGTDGELPIAGLIVNAGLLFGTTQGGGTSNEGTVFKLMPSGSSYAVLHNFTGSPDGSYPHAGLVTSGGALYGTTDFGGTSNDGTVFKLTQGGAGYTESVLHTFMGSDGAYPVAGLLVYAGSLYSTTMLGGTNHLGTVFKTTP